MKFCLGTRLQEVSAPMLRIHLALALLHEHHRLDHGHQAGAVQAQVHSAELGGQAVGAGGLGVLSCCRQSNSPTFPKAKIVLDHYLLTVFVGDRLRGKHISIKLFLQFL